MEINVSVQYNGGLLPDIMQSTRCNYIKFRITVVVVFFLMKRKLSPPPRQTKYSGYTI